MNNPGRHPHGARNVAILVLAAVVAVVALFVLTRADEAPVPEASTGVRAVSREFQTVPGMPRVRVRQIRRSLGRALTTLYERSFITDADVPVPTASPLSPTYRVDGLFTRPARRALRADPELFSAPEELRVTDGRVVFGGLAVLKGDRVHEAFLDVDFVANAFPRDQASPRVRVHQRGTMVLLRTGGRWLVRGFDLRFSTRPVPSPSPVAT